MQRQKKKNRNANQLKVTTYSFITFLTLFSQIFLEPENVEITKVNFNRKLRIFE